MACLRQDAVPLAESPYLMHPVENRTAALYKTPVAILVRCLTSHQRRPGRHNGAGPGKYSSRDASICIFCYLDTLNMSVTLLLVHAARGSACRSWTLRGLWIHTAV